MASVLSIQPFPSHLLSPDSASGLRYKYVVVGIVSKPTIYIACSGGHCQHTNNLRCMYVVLGIVSKPAVYFECMLWWALSAHQRWLKARHNLQNLVLCMYFYRYIMKCITLLLLQLFVSSILLELNWVSIPFPSPLEVSLIYSL